VTFALKIRPNLGTDHGAACPISARMRSEPQAAYLAIRSRGSDRPTRITEQEG